MRPDDARRREPGADPRSGLGGSPRDHGPRALSDALRAVRADVAPETLLAAVQAGWPRAAGERIADASQPVSERDGVVTIACRSSTWAQELDLLGPPLLERLNARPEIAARGRVTGLRFTADAARHD